MSNCWFASDHHMGHEGPYSKFTRKDGNFLRAPFRNADECDEHMIQEHNKLVKPNDRVYFVGDFCFSKHHVYKMSRMNGRKVLIKGNHDTLELKQYLPYVDDIRGVHQFDGMVITHIPIHEQSLGRWGFNVHGHLHEHRVMWNTTITQHNAEIDPRYFSVCVEQINYKPISLEEIKQYKPALELQSRT